MPTKFIVKDEDGKKIGEIDPHGPVEQSVAWMVIGAIALVIVTAGFALVLLLLWGLFYLLSHGADEISARLQEFYDRHPDLIDTLQGVARIVLVLMGLGVGLILWSPF